MHSLLVVIRVVRALILREMKTRFGQYKLGYIWALFEPLIWIAMFAGASIVGGRYHANGVPIVSFVAAGLMPFLLFMDTSAAATSAIGANQGLLVYPAIRPLDLVLARMALEAVTNIFVFVIILGGIAIWYGHLRIESPMTMVLALLLAVGLGTAWGLVCCGLTAVLPSFANILSYLTRPMFWISGLFFSVNELPKRVREILLWNPVLHCVELMRDGWFTTYNVRYVSLAYPATCVLVLLFFGLALERVVVRQMGHG